MKATNPILTFLILFSSVTAARTQPARLGIIDFYGNQSIKMDIKKCLPFKENDTIKFLTDSITYAHAIGPVIDCLEAQPEIKQAKIEFVCCAMEGKWLAFIGVSGKALRVKNNLKTKDIKLPLEITKTYDSLMEVLPVAIKSGQAEEDDSQGHSLFKHMPSRRLEERFIPYSKKYFDLLRDVLKYSKYTYHRTVASWVIAYYHDKTLVVNDLSEAANDVNEEVRNNAIRALGIMIKYLQDRPNLKVAISPDPFIALMNSISWTDRNKSVSVLLALSNKRDAKLFAKLKNEALASLIDMANWKSDGHAMPGYTILGRLAGWTDQEIFESSSKNRQEMVAKMLATIK